MTRQKFLKEIDIVVKGWDVDLKEKFLSTIAPLMYQLNEAISKKVKSDCQKIAFLLWDIGKKPEQIVNITAFDKINRIFMIEQEFDFKKFDSIDDLQAKYSCIIKLITQDINLVDKTLNTDLDAFFALLNEAHLRQPIVKRKVGRACKSESKTSKAQLFFNFDINQIELGVDISEGNKKETTEMIFAKYPTSMVSVLFEMGKLTTENSKLFYVPKSHYEKIEVCKFI